MTSQTLSSSLTSLIQKYNLDISIVEKEKLGVFQRIDPEFYQVNYYQTQNFLQKKWAENLWNISIVTDGEHGSPNLDPEWYICLSGTNIWSWEIVIDQNTKKITKSQYEKNQRVLLRKGNVLLSIVWTVGNSAVIREDIDGVTDRNVATIKISNNGYNPIFVSLFLNSKYGRLQTERFCTGNVQPLLNLTQVRSIQIPLPSPTFQSHIASLVQEAHKQRELSKSLYSEAENILLSELGLLDWQPSEENITEKMSAEVELFGRCDAEFFQPKYDEILERIRNYQWGHTTLERVLENIDTWEYSESYSKKQDDFVFYIRSTNINEVWLIDIDEDYYVDPSWFKRIAKKWQIITPRVWALGIFAYIDESLHWSIYSDNVLCMTLPSSFYPDVYSLYLNSHINKLLVERFSRGSVQQRLNQETLRFLEIPILPESLQSLISEKITASHLARETSKKLLEKAKRAVEIFIEEDESVGEKYIKA